MDRRIIKNNVIPLEIVQKHEGIHKDDFWSYIFSLHAIQTSSQSLGTVAPYETELRRMGWVNVTDYKNEMGRGVPQLTEFEETGEAMIVMLRSAVRSMEPNLHQACQVPRAGYRLREYLAVTYVVTCEKQYPQYPHPKDAVFVRWKDPCLEDMKLARKQNRYAQYVYRLSYSKWGSDENIRHRHLGLPRYWAPPSDED